MLNDAIALVINFNDKEKKEVCLTHINKKKEWVSGFMINASLDDVFEYSSENVIPIFIESENFVKNKG